MPIIQYGRKKNGVRGVEEMTIAINKYEKSEMSLIVISKPF